MKLAEALLERKHLGIQMEALSQKMSSVNVFRTEDGPKENAVDIYQKYLSVMEQFQKLIVRINTTNNMTLVEPEVSMMMALARRDVLVKLIKHYNSMISHAKGAGKKREGAYSGVQEVVHYTSQVDAKNLQDTFDTLSKEWRELDVLIQSANWSVELIN